MIVQIEPLEIRGVKCSHPRCDGRDAKWQFPQTKNRKRGKLVSCSVHIARIVEIIMRDEPVAVLDVHGNDHAA